jgi:outer membrane immunogenic protein
MDHQAERRNGRSESKHEEGKQMFRKSLLVMTLAGVASVALPAYAQSEEGRQEVAVQALGSFVTTTSQNGIDNTATNSGGVLASYRLFFSKHHGVEANYGYERNTQSYASAAGAVGVKTNSHEASGAYVFRMPFGKVTPFALAGVGALVFDPRDFLAASTQTRAGFVCGAGADFNVTHHLFMRAEYRGFVYNSPTYDLPVLAGGACHSPGAAFCWFRLPLLTTYYGAYRIPAVRPPNPYGRN